MTPRLWYSREHDDNRGFRVGSKTQSFPSHQSACYDGRQIQGLKEDLRRGDDDGKRAGISSALEEVQRPRRSVYGSRL
jgi:hypothetical protein